MITIFYPKDFIPERSYILEIIFGEFLGLEYKLIEYDGMDYKIILENHAALLIRDSFFSRQSGEEYLKQDNIPEKITFGVNPFTVESNIPILFGANEIQISAQTIVCGIDLFASAFFMLTRWEEFVNQERDSQNRFPALGSIAYKNGFLDRPVVNEYLEMLWNMLRHLGIEQTRKQRNFELILTHDVDHISYWKGPIRQVQVLGADIFKRRNLRLFFNNITDLTQVKLGKQRDPYDTFDYMMDLSEAAGLKSRFYFMSGGVTGYDNNYEITEAAAIIKRIKERGHIIGFHPSYAAYNQPAQWKMEKERLEEVTGFSVKEGRQHYLRFEAPLTWRIWDEHDMEMDCTLGYQEREGFRCGTCYEFSVFDFIKRKKLSLKEYPLTIMEGTLFGFQNMSPQEMEETTLKFLQITKKYNGNFVYLWHNSSFNTEYWKQHGSVYAKIIKQIKMVNS